MPSVGSLGLAFYLLTLVFTGLFILLFPIADPVALALGAKHTDHIRYRLMSFSLTGQTSQEGDVIAFDAETYPGPPDPDPVSEASFQWLLDAAGPRNEFWSAIFGTPEGPFDQYAVVASIRPELFDCRGYRVDRPGDFAAALADALACDAPAIIDVIVDPEARPPRMAMSREAR